MDEKNFLFSLALTGIDILEIINDKISKLDRALRSIEGQSNASKNQALVTSEKLRADAVQNGWILFFITNFILIFFIS
jgi:hypothetical protein